MSYHQIRLIRYGDVIRCTNQETKQAFAAKFISKKKSMNKKPFQNEIETMKLLDHPNIVKFCDVFDSTIERVIVMELASGGSLENKLEEEGKFSEFEAKALIFDITLALLYCHRKGIAHRDLKLGNILL